MTPGNAGFAAEFSAAQRLQQNGQLAEAEAAYLKLAAAGHGREQVLGSLVNLYLQAPELQKAAETLYTLIAEVPDNPTYYWDLATILEAGGNPAAAIQQYRRLTERQPDSASAQFNLAILCKRAFRYRDALAAYERAIDLGVDGIQEVCSNMGVLYSDMRDGDNAETLYERALAIDAGYVPALFNLAGLYEERGKREQARELYERILEREPGHWAALGRLAQTRKVTGADDPMFGRVRAAIAQAGNDPAGQEQLNFVLGKMLDDIARFEEAYAAYAAGNSLGKKRIPPYDPANTAKGFAQLAECFDRRWIDGHASDSTDSPIFIVGMFRSGSTLLEQMLGAHGDVVAAGELDFLPWLIARDLSPYPQRVSHADPAMLRQLADEYVALTRELFPETRHLTDKRPDNFLHLGLLRAMFPKARFIHTRRNRADNCLSILFQQFGNLAYATELEAVADYYDQHVRLMAHWQRCLGDGIITVNYEDLVEKPEPVLRGLLEFLGLEWDDRCLAFNESAALVKTASLWQVREGLHSSSRGRWRNYGNIVPGLSALAGNTDD